MNEKAILVVSFGTSYLDTLDKTIGAIERRLAASFPDRRFFRAFSSNFVVEKLNKKGYPVDSIAAALDRMAREGCRDILIQSTHIISAVEYELIQKHLEPVRDKFDTLAVGRPLLYSDETIHELLAACPDLFSSPGPDDALVLMGHGTHHSANYLYDKINEILHDRGQANVFMGTVEARPDFDSVTAYLDSLDRRPSKVWLAPFLIVVGDHATNDLAGDEEDSWKSRLAAAGYDVACRLKGMGEYEEIQDLFVKRARQALTA